MERITALRSTNPKLQASSPNYKKNHNPKFGIRNPSPEKQKTDDRRQKTDVRRQMTLLRLSGFAGQADIRPVRPKPKAERHALGALPHALCALPYAPQPETRNAQPETRNPFRPACA